MKRIKDAATSLGMGIGLVYMMFSWEPIYSLFPQGFILMIRQVLVITFGVCVLVNPQGIIDMAERIAPKIIALLNAIFIKRKDNGHQDGK